jgi:hypothetical protein
VEQPDKTAIVCAASVSPVCRRSGPRPKPVLTRLDVQFAGAGVKLVALPQTSAVEWSAASADHDKHRRFPRGRARIMTGGGPRQ